MERHPEDFSEDNGSGDLRPYEADFAPDSPDPRPEHGSGGWKVNAALFLSSQGLSLLGSMLVQYAIIWYLTLTTGSGVVLTLATLFSFLPQIVVSLFAGVWADRYDRRFLAVASDSLTAVSTLILTVFFLLDYREIWLILFVSGLRSFGAGIQTPAVNALLPMLVPGTSLIRINSLNATIQPLIMVIAPISAGALMSFSRLEYVFLIDILTAVLAVGLLLALKIPSRDAVRGEARIGYLSDLREGLTYVRTHRAIAELFLFYGFAFFLVVPAAFLSPLLVARRFGDEVWRLTANEVSFFIGSILGGAVLTFWGGFADRFRTIGLSCIIWAVMFSGLGLARTFPLYLIIMFLAGIPMPFLNASTTTLLQETVEERMQGRIFGLHQLIMTAVMPVGMLFFGPAADLVGIDVLLVASSALMALPGGFLFMSRTVSRSGFSPLGRRMRTGD